ncbi:MAG TPA: hypothetical protein VII51_03830 [Gaiellaceae bacterium]
MDGRRARTCAACSNTPSHSAPSPSSSDRRDASTTAADGGERARDRAKQLARVPDERLLHVSLAAERVVELDVLRIGRTPARERGQPSTDLEHERRLLHVGSGRAQHARDAGEPGVRIERRQRCCALARERAELVTQRREQLALVRVLLRERVRPGLLVRRWRRVSQRRARRSSRSPRERRCADSPHNPPFRRRQTRARSYAEASATTSS